MYYTYQNVIHFLYINLQIEVAPIDVENEVEEQIHGGVTRFVRTAGEDYFVSLKIILQTAKKQMFSIFYFINIHIYY